MYKAMNRITPFHFTNLPKVSPERIKLSQAMSSCLPGLRWEETFRELLATVLRKYIRGKRQLMLNFQISSDEAPEEQWEKNFSAIEKDTLMIGRNAACELHLNNRVVSSQHARIVANKGQYYIIDQSANGTFLNGKQVPGKTPTLLNNGDTIGIYPYQLVFTLNQIISSEETHVGFKIENIAEFSYAEVARKLATPIPLAVVGIEPFGRKALLELDPNFLIGMVDLIFGSEGNPSSKLLRTLSNIETGVIEFLLLRLIKTMSDTTAAFSSTTVRLEQLLIQGGQVLKNPEAIAEANEPVLQVTTRVSVAELLGYFNLYFPYGLLKSAAEQEVTEQNELNLLRIWLPRVETVKTELVTEIGEIKLSSAELPTLEPNDIILLQDVNLKFYGTELSGEVNVRLGLWGETCFRGDIITDETGVKAILNSAYKNPRKHANEGGFKENPMTTDAQPEGGEIEDNDLAQSADFVQSVPVTIVVELGRRNLTISDVTRLRIGQIIDLQRTPSEPVDLTVDGKIIGKGELVDVDGELGVRILRLFK
ncbi:MAG: type III secretion system cytoplasmic ring protein SctQ [Acidobacteriota bacterium]